MSFRLPSGETDHVYQVKLRDGRIVYRTKEELEELPPEVRATASAPASTGTRT
jgi:hypothetical protein